MEDFKFWDSRSLFVYQRVVYGSKCGNNSRLCAENQTAQRRFLKTGALRRGQFGFSPAAFGTNRQRRRKRLNIGKRSLQRRRLGAFRKAETDASGIPGKGLVKRSETLECGNADAPRLLRGLQEDLFPSLGSLRCRGEQGLLASVRCERHNRVYSQFGGLFNSPFESVKLDYGQQERDVNVGLNGGQLLDQGKLHAIAADTFDPAEPNPFAVAQFIELAGLCAQHASQVMRRFAFHYGSVVLKLLNEESSSHAEILS